MPPTSADALLARMLGSDDQIPSGKAQAGARWRCSAAFKRIAAGGLAEVKGAPLLRADELARAIRVRAVSTTLDNLEAAPPRIIEPFPIPARVPSLVTTRTTGKFLVEFAPQVDFTLTGGGTPVGVEVDEMSATFGIDREEGTPFGVKASVPTEVLTDADAAEQAIDDLLDKSFTWNLEWELLNGDGSTAGTTQHLNGILSNPDVPEVVLAAGQYRYDAIAAGVASVQAHGFFDEPLAVVANPNTIERIRTERATGSGEYLAAADVVPDVSAWVPSNRVDDGTAIVGAWAAGMLVWLREGLSLQTTQQYADYWSRGLSVLMLRTRLSGRVRRPKAFAAVRGL
jgi:hypothetical protein